IAGRPVSVTIHPRGRPIQHLHLEMLRRPVEFTLYTGVAVVANVTPFVATLYAPRCLPGYVVCKLTYAGLSLAAAADQLVLSGGGDLAQTRAILHRGFAGDWYLTGRHVAGEVEAEPLPEPPAPAPGSGEGGWQPPPLCTGGIP